MDKLPDLPQPTDRKSKKLYRKCQPFWNAELEQLWFNVCKSERAYTDFRVQCNGDLHYKSTLRIDYKTAQKTFDKRFRFY